MDKIPSNIEQGTTIKGNGDDQNNKDKKAQILYVYRTINDGTEARKQNVAPLGKESSKIVTAQTKAE